MLFLSLRNTVGDNSYAPLWFSFGGFGFLSVSAQSELREQALVGRLALTS